MVAAPVLNGKRGGEVEYGVGKLTTLSNRAEVDRRTGIDGEGRSSMGSVMAAAAGRPDFGREWLNRAHGGAGQVRGEARELGARRNRAGAARGGWSNAGGGLCSLCSARARRRRRRGGENDVGRRERIRTVHGGRGSPAHATRGVAGVGRGMGVGEHSVAQ